MGSTSENSSPFILREYRGRIERGLALTQDVSPKYFNLAQTSKLVFFFFFLSHPFLEAESIEQPSRLNTSCGGVWGTGGVGEQNGVLGRKNTGRYLKNVSCCIKVVGFGTTTHLVGEHATC